MKRNFFITFILLFSGTFFFSSFSLPEEETPHALRFEYATMFGSPFIPADNPLTEEGIWLGRLLFYDGQLSVTGKISCGSCHQQKLFFTDGLPLAIGVHGDTLKRNTMSLINLAWDKNFFWDGRDTSIEQVVRDHISNQREMGGLSEKELVVRLKSHKYYPGLFKLAFPKDTISMYAVSKAIAQFTRVIVSNFKETEETYKKTPGGMNNRDWLNEETQTASGVRMALMQCKSCHGKPAGEKLAFYTDGVKYKAPSLVNIRYTAPYMHDGRFKSLKDVLLFYNLNLDDVKQKNPHLVEGQELSAAFTKYDIEHADELFDNDADVSIITNVAYSNPFNQKGFTWNMPK